MLSFQANFGNLGSRIDEIGPIFAPVLENFENMTMFIPVLHWIRGHHYTSRLILWLISAAPCPRIDLCTKSPPCIIGRSEQVQGCFFFFFFFKFLKGALDNFSLIPIFFFQKSWDFYIIRSVYLCSDCMLNLTCSFNSVTKIYEFFFQ